MHRCRHKIAKLTRPLNLAEHPLYKRPDPPHLEPPVDLTGRSGFFKYHHAMGWPDSAVPAEMSNIPRWIVPFAFYFDLLKRCIDCGRDFVFFAKEQRYWFETLKIPLEADAIRCVSCRRTARSRNRDYKRYSHLAASPVLDDAELEELTGLFLTLWKDRTITDRHKLARLAGRTRRQLPDSPKTGELLALHELVNRCQG
jgi:hypothetical protein